jgi:hypothetical protein
MSSTDPLPYRLAPNRRKHEHKELERGRVPSEVIFGTFVKMSLSEVKNRNNFDPFLIKTKIVTSNPNRYSKNHWMTQAIGPKAIIFSMYISLSIGCAVDV